MSSRRWSEERYVRLYTRENPDWILLSWQARALFHEILKKVDRAGVLMLGKHGTKSIAVIVHMPIDVVDGFLPELIEDGCIVMQSDRLVLPNFMEAQEAFASDAARKRAERDRKKARANAMGHQDTTPPPDGTPRPGNVTNRDEVVTRRDALVTPADEGVTNFRDSVTNVRDTVTLNHADLNHAVLCPPRVSAPMHTHTREGLEPEIAPEPTSPPSSTRPVRLIAPPDMPRERLQGPARAILDAIEKHELLAPVALPQLANQIACDMGTGGKKLDWIVAAIDDAASKATTLANLGTPLGRDALADRVVTFCRNAKPPRVVQNSPGPRGFRPDSAHDAPPAYQLADGAPMTPSMKKRLEQEAAAASGGRR